MSERTYRLSPPDRTGWFLGLGAAQVVLLGSTLVVGAIAANYGAPLGPVAAGVAVVGVLVLARCGGRPLIEWVPSLWRRLQRWRRGATWLAPLAPLGAPAPNSPMLPPPLSTQMLQPIPGPGGREMGVVMDAAAGTYAATVRVSGRQFALVERGEQDGLLSLWGDALAAFCREGGPVMEVRWSEWAAPAGMEEQHAYLAEHAITDVLDPAVASYRELLRNAAPVATRHEVLLTVVISSRRVRPAAGAGGAAASAVKALAEELRLLTRRLEAAGLAVSSPLSVPEVGRALRVRLDPQVISTLDCRSRSLGDRAGLVTPAAAGPLAASTAWDHWRVDGSLHRAFYVAEWPRADVGPTWMSDLLLYGGGVRTVAMCYHPVPPRVSQRTILRQAAKLDADVDQRRRTGFRVGAHHRRAARAVEEREEELVAGYAELEYVGIVDVCAPNLEALELACADVVQVSAGCGIELRALHGRHEDGVAACLPLARGLAHHGMNR